MNCGCDKHGLTNAKIRHVYGNVLRIAVPLTKRTVEVVDGVITAVDTDFVPSTDYPIAIILDKGNAQLKMLAQLRGNNIAYFEDKGTIPVGVYSITVTCKDDDSNPYRFKERAVLQVVDVTADAGIKPGIEYDAEEYYLDNAVFFASGAAGATALQSYTETDPTVPAWAKASTKPTYTASEISGLANVATSGSYNDLADKPTIQAAYDDTALSARVTVLEGQTHNVTYNQSTTTLTIQ